MEERRVARAEWGPEEAHAISDHVFDQCGAIGNLRANVRSAHVHQPGVGHGVATDEMAGLMQRAHDLRLLLHVSTNHEEARLHLMVRQDIHELTGVGIVGTVVEGESDLRWIITCDE
jgi:hypothetical protein